MNVNSFCFCLFLAGKFFEKANLISNFCLIGVTARLWQITTKQNTTKDSGVAMGYKIVDTISILSV